MPEVQTDSALRLEWNENYETTIEWIRCHHCGETAKLTLPDKVIECLTEECKLKRFKFGFKFGDYRYE